MISPTHITRLIVTIIIDSIYRHSVRLVSNRRKDVSLEYGIAFAPCRVNSNSSAAVVLEAFIFGVFASTLHALKCSKKPAPCPIGRIAMLREPSPCGFGLKASATMRSLQVIPHNAVRIATVALTCPDSIFTACSSKLSNNETPESLADPIFNLRVHAKSNKENLLMSTQFLSVTALGIPAGPGAGLFYDGDWQGPW